MYPIELTVIARSDSDEAIQASTASLDCFASLAMTVNSRLWLADPPHKSDGKETSQNKKAGDTAGLFAPRSQRSIYDIASTSPAPAARPSGISGRPR
jgi:hypothetical protein